MGDTSKWDIDSNGYYLTDYTYIAPSTSPYITDEQLMSKDTKPITHTITFDEASDIKINYSIGMMYQGPGLSPSAGVYYNYKTANGNNAMNLSLSVDNLGEASEINSIENNPIVLTEREVTLENIKELTIWTSGRPVLWVDYIQIEVLE